VLLLSLQPSLVATEVQTCGRTKPLIRNKEERTPTENLQAKLDHLTSSAPIALGMKPAVGFPPHAVAAAAPEQLPKGSAGSRYSPPQWSEESMPPWFSVSSWLTTNGIWKSLLFGWLGSCSGRGRGKPA
jgi:hypothetical protein